MFSKKAADSLHSFRAWLRGNDSWITPRNIAVSGPWKEALLKKCRLTRGRSIQLNCLVLDDSLSLETVACAPVNTHDSVETLKAALKIPDRFLLTTLKAALPANPRHPTLKAAWPSIYASAMELTKNSPAANSRSTTDFRDPADKILNRLSNSWTFLEAGLGRPLMGQLHLVAFPPLLSRKDFPDFLRSSPSLPHYIGARSSSNTSPYHLGSSEAAKEIESPYFIECASCYVPDYQWYLNQDFGQSALIDHDAFKEVKLGLALLSTSSSQTTVLRSESDVRPMSNRVHYVLSNALRCFGSQIKFEPEHKDSSVHVKPDYRILLLDYHGGTIKVLGNWEDKSISAFSAHCQDTDIQKMHGFIQLQPSETGTRSIFLKLGCLLIAQNAKFGVVHDGKDMILVLLERKNLRPYLVVSPRIPMAGTRALELLFSLLCTSADSDISLVDSSIAARVPPPPEINRGGD